MKNLTIALVDDQQLVRQGFKLIIESFKDMQVVLEASNGNDLLSQLEEAKTHPDIILLDLNMKGMNGIDTAKHLANDYPQIDVAVMSLHCTTSLVKLMFSLEVSAYFSKKTSHQELEFGLRQIAEKGSYFSTEFYEKMGARNVNGKKPSAGIESSPLTGREREVLNLICKEYSTSEIAETLSIGRRTVDSHRKGLLRKTRSKNVAGLVIYSMLNDLVRVDEIAHSYKKVFGE